MEQLKAIKEQITSLVQGQLANVQNVDTKELGEAIDMIKDLAEATYYCSITEAMEEGKEEQKKGNTYYYTTPMMMPYDDYEMGRMYYGGRGSGSSSGSGSGNSGGGRSYYSTYNPVKGGMGSEHYYTERPMSMDMFQRDPLEGRSPRMRKMYMESQKMHDLPAKKEENLENYMTELSKDITEMIKEATPEEKQILQQKLTTLSSKIM